MPQKQSAKDIAVRVSAVGMAGNILLTVFKLVAGIVGHSGAMISDAIHSASDVFSGLIVIIGVRISSKDSDPEHPYGHERFECVAAILLSVLLCLAGGAIGVSAVKTIASGGYLEHTVTGWLALIAAVTSVIVKEAMFWYTHIYAKKIDSTALKAEAWHHRSDALSSVGAIIGIGGAKLGFPVLEPIASAVICLFIIKVAIDIFRDAIDRMVDRSCDTALEDSMKQCALEVDGVMSVDLLQTRVFGSKVYVDIEIGADSTLTLKQAHQIAENVHSTVEVRFPQVKHIMVHVNPKGVSE